LQKDATRVTTRICSTPVPVGQLYLCSNPGKPKPLGKEVAKSLLVLRSGTDRDLAIIGEHRHRERPQTIG